MNRLTGQAKLKQARLLIKLNGADVLNDSTLIYAKLGRLEDVEERLGIGLDILIDAMENGVYVVNINNEIVFVEPMICFNKETITGSYILDNVFQMPPDTLTKHPYYYLESYGITWALTKEELTHEKH